MAAPTVRPRASRTTPTLRVAPLTPARWRDLESLFGPNGACAGCWCMWWRLRGRAFSAGRGGPNRRALRRIVEAREIPGLLAYRGRRAVGWCCIAPRERFPRLEASRVLARVDEEPVWSVVCFFVTREFRRAGVTATLLRAALKHAAARGARLVEGYPLEVTKGKRLADVWAWTGFASAFRRAGFREVARRSRSRPILRKILHGRG